MTGSSTAHNVNWWELNVPDLAAAQEFYAAVFGWGFQPFGDDYAAALLPDGTMIGGLQKADGTVGGRGVNVYVGTDDLEGVLDRAVANGGAVADARTEVGGDMGWWAAFTDPSGLRVGVSTMQPPA